MKHDICPVNNAITRRNFIARAAAVGGAAGLIPVIAGSCEPGRRQPFDAGESKLRVDGRTISMGNDAIAAKWSVSENRLQTLDVVDLLTNRRISLAPNAFALNLADGTSIESSAMRLARGPRVARLVGDPAASRYADRVDGQIVTLELADDASGVVATWRGILRNGSGYIRQELTLTTTERDVPIKSITLVESDVPDAGVVGTVPGSPIVARNMFLGFEHPLSESTVEDGRTRSKLSRALPLRPGAPLRYSSVIGVTPTGQLRRGFLNYVERERAHPYRPFLHYNSWYDLGYFSPFDESGALTVIEAYGTELHDKRGVVLDSFLFDDGWDNHTTLWKFNSGFPNGFTPLRDAAARYGAAPGVWMSPWGGYGEPRRQRLENGRAHGFETNERGFALSGPKYYERFRDTCMDMIRTYGVNQFKFDGTGDAANAITGSQFDSDFDAAIHLIGELRGEKPDLYVNLTTGTYPSPFWLKYADSTWRGGSDHNFTGVGSDRQQWITYRDAATYRGVVQRGPLYPLNALMLHGLIYATHAKKLDTDPQDDFADEIRAYFGSGTQLQEMYVTPSLLTQDNWDTLAESANWARANADILVDTHWVGGDPEALEVYGRASWNNDAGILVLRNPKDTPQSIELDIAAVFELPDGEGARTNYTARSPWHTDADKDPVRLSAGEPYTFSLQPFEVLTLEAHA